MLELGSGGGLFVAAFASATLLPGGSELWLAALVQQQPEHLWYWWSLATLGNTLGSLTTFALGGWLSGRWGVARFNKRGQQRALVWLRRYGAWSLLLAWLPVVGDGLCLLAGWLRCGWPLACVLIALGKGARYLLVAGIMSLI